MALQKEDFIVSCPLDRYRFILGSLIVGTLVVLAVAIALGHVEEKTSYGLVPVVTILAKVALDFSEWAFRPRDKPEVKDNAGDGLGELMEKGRAPDLVEQVYTSADRDAK